MKAYKSVKAYSEHDIDNQLKTHGEKPILITPIIYPQTSEELKKHFLPRVEFIIIFELEK